MIIVRYNLILSSYTDVAVRSGIGQAAARAVCLRVYYGLFIPLHN